MKPLPRERVTVVGFDDVVEVSVWRHGTLPISLLSERIPWAVVQAARENLVEEAIGRMRGQMDAALSVQELEQKRAQRRAKRKRA